MKLLKEIINTTITSILLALVALGLHIATPSPFVKKTGIRRFEEVATEVENFLDGIAECPETKTLVIDLQ